MDGCPHVLEITWSLMEQKKKSSLVWGVGRWSSKCLLSFLSRQHGPLCFHTPFKSIFLLWMISLMSPNEVCWAMSHLTLNAYLTLKLIWPHNISSRLFDETINSWKCMRMDDSLCINTNVHLSCIDSWRNCLLFNEVWPQWGVRFYVCVLLCITVWVMQQIVHLQYIRWVQGYH